MDTSSGAQQGVVTAAEDLLAQITRWFVETLGDEVEPRVLQPRRQDHKGPQWWLPCPRSLYLRGEDDNPHPNRGGRKGFNGDHRAWLRYGPEGPVLKCRHCTEGSGGLTPEAFTAEVIQTLGLTVGNVTALGTGQTDLRSHRYPLEGGGALIHVKFERRKNRKVERGWRWDHEAPDGTVTRIVGVDAARADPTKARQTAMALLGTTVSAAAGIYRAAAAAAAPDAVLVFCEGEKDAETAAALIAICGAQDRYVAVAVPTMTFGEELPPSIVNGFMGRAVVTVFDPDSAGERFEQKWPGALWTFVRSWGVVRLPRGEGDLTEWVEKQPSLIDAAAGFLEMLEAVDPLTEPPLDPFHWRAFPERTASGGPARGSNLNVRHLLMFHPDCRGTIRRHKLTGQFVTVGAPWTGDERIRVWPGFRSLAAAAQGWMSDRAETPMSFQAFREETFADLAAAAPPYSPHEALLATPWDGEARAERLFTRWIRVKAPAGVCGALGRAFALALLRALRGEPRDPKTPLPALRAPDELAPLDIARRVAGEHGATIMREKIGVGLVTEAMADGAVLIEAPIAAIGRFQVRLQNGDTLLRDAFPMPSGERIGAPALIFVGTEHDRIEEMRPPYLLLDVEELAPDPIPFEQIVAEAKAERARWEALGWAALHAPRATLQAAYDRLDTIGRAVGWFVFHSAETANGDPLSYNGVLRSPRRLQPRDRVVYDEFLRTMELYLARAYGTRFSEWLVRRDLTDLWRWLCGKTLHQARLPRTMDPNRPAGFPLDRRALGRLEGFLKGGDEDDEGGPPPETGFDDDSPPSEPGGSKIVAENSVDAPGFFSENRVMVGLPSGYLNTSQEAVDDMEKNGVRVSGLPSPHTRMEDRAALQLYARTHAVSYTYLAGQPGRGIEAAKILLAENGECGIDFETWPGDPDLWVRRNAEPGAARRKPEEVRRWARYENAAARRVPCVLTLAKPDGRTAWVRLPEGRAAAREALREIFAAKAPGCRLVAHNAVFEAEVLKAAGIEVDIECTMVASKLLYAEALADEDEEGGEFQLFVDPEDDVGIVGPGGALDLDRLRPVGGLRRHSLAACLAREFGETRDKSVRSTDWASDAAEGEAEIAYAVADAVDALRLWAVYGEALDRLGLTEGYRNLMQALPAVAEINVAGLRVDADRRRAWLADLDERIAEGKAELAKLTPKGVRIAVRNFNDGMRWFVLERLWNAVLRAEGSADTFAAARARHMVEVTLGEAERLPGFSDYWEALRDAVASAGFELHSTPGPRDPETGRRERPGMATSKVGLRAMIDLLDATGIDPELEGWLKAYRDLNAAQTLRTNLGDGFEAMIDPATRRVSGHVQLAGAVTGRQSCRDVNLQQVPRDGPCREMFVPAPGKVFVIADYSQVELRIAAVVARDEALYEVYRQGLDVHAATASKCFGLPVAEVPKRLRQLAKAVNFGCVYGAGAGAIAVSAVCPTREAEALLAAFLGAYEGIARYRKEASEAEGDIVIEPRRRVMAGAEIAGPKRVNYPIQGGAASVQHRALRLVWEALRRSRLSDRATIVGAIHDEILVECDEEVAAEVLALVREAMTAALLEIFPDCEGMGRDRLVSAETAHSWAEKA